METSGLGAESRCSEDQIYCKPVVVTDTACSPCKEIAVGYSPWKGGMIV